MWSKIVLAEDDEIHGVLDRIVLHSLLQQALLIYFVFNYYYLMAKILNGLRVEKVYKSV